jgi:trehalose 6-phosphate synthase/phosphatase
MGKGGNVVNGRNRLEMTGDTGEGRSPGFDGRVLPRRFLVASNRLPYQIDAEGDSVSLTMGVGGLVTALEPLLHKIGGTWIGWSGKHEPVPEEIIVSKGGQDGGGNEYRLVTVQLSRKEVQEYYLGYSNRCLWPLLHYFQEHCEFNDEQWRTYREVNHRFARAVIKHHRPDDFVWIHDYHLMLVPGMVRKEIPDARIGFFLHIPFPPPELFMIDIHAEEILEGLLGADLIGFHTEDYANNFLRTAAALTGHRFDENDASIRVGGSRRVQLGSFPISIDCDRFTKMASSPRTEETCHQIRAGYNAEILAVGVDRLDYSKGILERLKAIEIMLEKHPELQGKFTFIQSSAPSRTKVHAYQEMRERIEGMVGRVNGRFGGRGCIPIDYRYEGKSQEDLVALYRAADLALVTPLRDGMNLVAKEYVVSRIDHGGALVLSRFAGAVDELKEAVLVNPYHPENTADGIFRAITMPDDEKRRRMQSLRETVLRNDIYWWLERFSRAMQEPFFASTPSGG